MIICLFLSLALPSAWGYTVQVNGKVEMGDQMAHLLRQFHDVLEDSDIIVRENPSVTPSKVKLTNQEYQSGKERKAASVGRPTTAPVTSETSGGLWPLLMKNIPFIELNLQADSPTEKIKQEMALLNEMVDEKQKLSDGKDNDEMLDEKQEESKVKHSKKDKQFNNINV